MNIKLDFKDFHALDDRLKASRRSVPIIVQRVLQDEFKILRAEIRPQIPAKTGRIRRHFSFSVRRVISGVRARIGFITKTTRHTAIAANVMQHGSNVTPKKGAYLWIPFPGNRQVTGAPLISPREVFSNREDFFVGKSKLGNLLAFRKSGGPPLFVLKKFVRVPARPIEFEERVRGRMPKILRSIEQTIAAVIEGKRRSDLK